MISGASAQKCVTEQPYQRVHQPSGVSIYIHIIVTYSECLVRWPRGHEQPVSYNCMKYGRVIYLFLLIVIN